MRIFLGDLTTPQFGLADDEYQCAGRIDRLADPLRGIAESQIRKAVPQRQPARHARSDSTRAPRAGSSRPRAVFLTSPPSRSPASRQDEVVQEDTAIDWARSDYDPYARTKKFCEHMVHQLLPDVPRTIFRPAIVLGDSRRPETTQFDMVQAFSVLASLAGSSAHDPTIALTSFPPITSAKPSCTFIRSAAPKYPRYHLSSGTGSQTYRELTDALAQAGGSRPSYLAVAGRYRSPAPSTGSRTRRTISAAALLCLKVFWPYLIWNTVFDNSRVVEELGGEAPAKFSTYARRS